MMTHAHDTSLVVLLLLGAVHGINPAMGWLFAVSLGLQEQRRGAVWSALGPLALGHALAIVAVVGVAAGIGFVVPVDVLKWVVAAALLVFGVAHLVRHRHFRYGGMRVGARELTVWSFLMATAHGAGLMALPFVMEMAGGASATAAAPHAGHGGEALAATTRAPDAAAVLASPEAAALLGTLAHSLGYLLVAALVAVVVYEKLGLRLLRSAWINMNVLWAAALIVTAILTPLL